MSDDQLKMAQALKAAAQRARRREKTSVREHLTFSLKIST